MLLRFLMYPLAALVLTCTGLAQAQTNAAADVAFKHLDDYLKNNSLDFETSFDATSDGNELYRGTGHFLIRRPNQLHAEITLAGSSYLVISDGTILTIYDTKRHKYSQTASPTSTAAAFGFFAGELGIDSQVLDFMGVVDNVVSGTDGTKTIAAGSDTVGGQSCDKFTVSGPSGDDTWLVWLDKSDNALLCKLIYRSVDGPAQTNSFKWNPTPTLTQQSFEFTPPAGSSKIDIGDLNLASP